MRTLKDVVSPYFAISSFSSFSFVCLLRCPIHSVVEQTTDRQIHVEPHITIGTTHSWCYSARHQFIQAISIAPRQVHYYSEPEVLPKQHGYCVVVFTPKRHRQL